MIATYVKSKGAKLYAESTGEGPTVIFVHEFADNLKSWAGQISAFSRRFNCIAFNARGYPPSEVPQDPELYSQRIAAESLFPLDPRAHSQILFRVSGGRHAPPVQSHQPLPNVASSH